MINKTILATCVIIAAGIPTISAEVLSSTRVAQGHVQGVVENGMGYFKAIPYAEPPVGELRWKDPVPKKAWEGVLMSDEFGPLPWQGTAPGTPAPRMSEDCLYLSVLTPAESTSANLPVMVWIHGGGFTGGYYAQNQCFSLAEHGVVAVSVEYRQGVFGFLAHPELSAENPDNVSGNYGLKDQILALRWVKDNIRNFGGNPDNITIFGESAGAISVSMLCASPEAKGLFVNAISESGGNFGPIVHRRRNNNENSTLKGGEEIGLEYMNALGKKSIAELRAMSPEEVTAINNWFWPICDGKVIVGNQYELYENGQYNDVNILIGSNSDEGGMFVRPASVADYEEQLKRAYGDFADEILKVYPAKDEKETYFALADIFSATGFTWPTYAWAHVQGSVSDKNIFVYYFDQPIEAPWLPADMVRGAPHGADVAYIFGELSNTAKPEDKKLSDTMIAFWTNFAKTGNPNGEGLPYWPKYDENGKTVMHFRNGTELTGRPDKERIDFWNSYFARLRAEDK